ncbi:hypothetical protein ID866_8530 [Astraeus odoratus]|nr:hypothetical protein ID866_8530 [Astraeus odoratus]
MLATTVDMEPATPRTHRGRGLTTHHDGGGPSKKPLHRNRHWVADGVASRNGTSTPHLGSDGEKWERGGHRAGRGRGRGTRGRSANVTATFRRNVVDGGSVVSEGEQSEMEDETEVEEAYPQDPESPEDREKFWQELVKAREAERKKAIAEGKMDDPLVQKSLKDAITMRTLDYLFHDLLPRGGFSAAFSFIRDRSRAVRNDFTMQHEMGPIAIECHDRCARFHILAIHVERSSSGFSVALEEQQLMNTLQSLKEFYEDQRGRYQSPTELEMRVYHRLIHIRDQRERHEDIPESLLNHPVFELTTKFRARVQANSAPITKNSTLLVDAEAMQIFAELAGVLRREGNVVMTYLVACILERLFGTDTIEDIEALRGDLSYSDIIDGYSGPHAQIESMDSDAIAMDQEPEDRSVPSSDKLSPQPSPRPLQPSGTQWLNDNFGPRPIASVFSATQGQSDSSLGDTAFSNLSSVPNVFGTGTFGVSASSEMQMTSMNPFALHQPKESGSSIFGPSPSTSTDNLQSSSLTPENISLEPFQAATTAFSSAGLVPTVIQSSGFNGHANHSTSVFTIQSSASPLSEAQPDAPPPLEASALPTSTSFEATAPSIRSVSLTVTNSAHRPMLPTDVDTSQSTGLPVPTHNPVVEQELSLAPASCPPSTLPIVIPDHSLPSMNVNNDPQETPPIQPPPLHRRQPISLPSTPTATVFVPSSLSQKPKSIFGSLKSIQTSSLSQAATEILSPLVIPSPSASRFLPSSVPRLLRQDSQQLSLRAVQGTADANILDEKSNPPILRAPEKQERMGLVLMDATALKFTRSCSLVKSCFSRWRQRLSERAKCTTTPEKKRKTAPAETLTSAKRRVRKRLSGGCKPVQTDEELARRFEKVGKDGLLGYLDPVTGPPLPTNWAAWLSLNQDNDGTAIWLEQKFDIPNSGKWKTENVFQIPVARSPGGAGDYYPGVIFFERTPLNGISDVLEKKYRVLDDCARLREVFETLPPNRHYIPSLICISWSSDPPDVTKDFDGMVAIACEDGRLTSHHDLTVASDALDTEAKLEELLKSIPFDRDGRLVRWISTDDLFVEWERIWDEVNAWLSKCTVYGEFHWDLYISLLRVVVQLLCYIIASAVSLLRDEGVQVDLPALHTETIVDSYSTFYAVLYWLEELPATTVTSDLVNDVKTHKEMGRDFPTLTFIPQLYTLGRALVLHIADLDPDIQVLEDQFKASHVARSRIPPKRIPSTSSNNSAPAKRRRLSDSEASILPEEDLESPPITSHEPSPSPSVATSVPWSDKAPLVTPAMLRSLTRDIRAKYGQPAALRPSS